MVAHVTATLPNIGLHQWDWSEIGPLTRNNVLPLPLSGIRKLLVENVFPVAPHRRGLMMRPSTRLRRRVILSSQSLV